MKGKEAGIYQHFRSATQEWQPACKALLSTSIQNLSFFSSKNRLMTLSSYSMFEASSRAFWSTS
eukprot:scaffold7040_cov256-Pinguiococcus_pyrenoidosus.AAC.5